MSGLDGRTNNEPFALVLDRFVAGTVDIGMRQADGRYEFSDGDSYVREGVNLGMFEPEFVTHAQLEARLASLIAPFDKVSR